MYSRRGIVVCLLLLTLSVGLLIVGACKDRGGRAPVSGATPSPTPSCSPGERLFAVVNNYTQPIWLGVTGGATGDSCANGASCGQFAQCDTANNICFWQLPEVGQINLQPGDSTTVCFPAPPPGSSVQWSGNMFARTGCDSNGQNCQTGGCANQPSQLCPVGVGGNQPTTLVEFTLSNQTATAPQSSPTPTPTPPDFYDISIINGINIGASIAPVSGTFQPDAFNPYFCGAPGSQSQPGPLEPCNWTITPTVNSNDYTTYLRDVVAPDPTPTPCTNDSDCSSAGLVCGLMANSTPQQFAQVCGTQVGWWTAYQVCTTTIGGVPFGTPFDCASTVKNSDGTLSTYTNLFACTSPANSTKPYQAQSCYLNGAAVDCCGCPTNTAADYTEWPNMLSPPCVTGTNGGCYNNNPNWVQVAQPWMVFLKQACPTAYTFPFDDPTSLFTCTGSSGPPSYTVTFFPTN